MTRLEYFKASVNICGMLFFFIASIPQIGVLWQNRHGSFYLARLPDDPPEFKGYWVDRTFTDHWLLYGRKFGISLTITMSGMVYFLLQLI